MTPVTIRFPKAVLTAARKTKGKDESFNDLVVRAVEREAKRRDGVRLFDELIAARDRIWAKAGIQPSSAPLIRAMREGRERR